LYSNIAITPIEVTARTFFPYSSNIASSNATGLPTGLTLSNGFIRGSPTSSGGVVTLSATNSNGIIGTTRITVAVNQVTINVSPSVTALQTYIVGQAIPTVTFTVTSPAYANIDLNDPTWTSTILNLPPGVTPVFNGNTVTLNGVPILSSITTGRQLTLSVLSPDQTRSSGTFQYKVDPDEFTFIPSTSSYIFAQNVTITPIQINVTTKSGSPVRYYTSVDLPVGLYISAAGLIQGTPLQSGSSFLSFNANNGYTIASSPQTLRYTTTLDVVRVVSSNTSNVLVAGTSSNLPIALSATTVSGFSVAKLVAMNYLYGMAINLYSSGYPINFDSNGVPFTYSANGVQTIAYSTIVDKFDSNGIPITVNSSGRFVIVYSFGTPSNGWTQRVSYGGTPPYTVYTYSNGNTITAYSNISNAIDGRVTSCVSPAIVLPPKTIINLIGSNIIGGETTTSTTQIELQGTGTQLVTRYVLKGNPYSLYTSTDGENYSLVTTYSSYVPHEFQWNSTSNVFLIADGSSTVYSNSVPVLFDQPVSSVTYGDRWYAAGNNVIFASPDGTNWTTINFSGNVNIPITSGIILRDIGDRIIVGSALGEFNSCLQYFDTNVEGTYVIYQATPSDILSNVNTIYTGSRLIAAGAKGTSTLCYSSDGITWLPCSNDFTGVAYDVVAGAMNLGLIATGSNLVGGYSIKYSTDGIAWSDVVGLPTFAKLGPIQWDGTSWVVFVDSNKTYSHDALVSTILDATTWELATISFPSNGTVHLFPKPIYGTVAVPPTPTLVIGVTSVGPTFISPTQVDNAYQYVPIAPIIFDAGPGVVFFLASTLPRGMSWNTNIPVSTNYYRASITGQSVQIGTFQITVYAQSPVGITRKTFTIVVREVFTSVDHATAAAYTAYTREKVIADAVVNARDNRVLPSSVGPFLLDRPKDVETVVICCD
jgi:hypothetical protein